MHRQLGALDHRRGILNRLGAGKFRAFSAGSQPKGEVNPHAIALLKNLNHDTRSFARSPGSEFAAAGAPELDFVFTVCDNAAGEACPVWPGRRPARIGACPIRRRRRAAKPRFRRRSWTPTACCISALAVFVALPLASLDQTALAEAAGRHRPHAGRGHRQGRERGVTRPALGRRLLAEGSALHSCWRRWWARASWPSGWRAGTWRWRCCATRSRPAPSWSVIILIFAPVSGAHFNPAVSLAFAARGELPWRMAALYVVWQIAGGVLGVWAAHLMFELPVLQLSLKLRTGFGQWFAEAVAAFGLVLAILGCVARAPSAVPYAVGLYITAAYWFTASTSFANPAVTVARALSDTFAGIAPAAWRRSSRRRSSAALAPWRSRPCCGATRRRPVETPTVSLPASLSTSSASLNA
jgi:hypothetical protein